MALTWNETAWEHIANGMALYLATNRQPTVEDLKAIRLRLRSAIVELDREIAAGPLRVSGAERNGAGVEVIDLMEALKASLAKSGATPRPLLCKLCAEPLETITEQTDGICAPCLKDGDDEASVYSEDA